MIIITDKDVKQLMDSIAKLVDKKIDERQGNTVQIKPGTVTGLSLGGTKASVRLLGENKDITGVDVYGARNVSIGDKCHVQYWGTGGKRLNNAVLVFNG